MVLVIESTAIHLKCQKCGRSLALLTEDVLRVTCDKREVSIYPGTHATIRCECGAKKDFVLALRVLDKAPNV